MQCGVPAHTDGMPVRLHHIVVDAHDLPGLARFWTQALGWKVLSEREREIVIGTDENAPVGMCFMPVTDPKTVKNRVHLDLTTSAQDRDQEIERILRAYHEELAAAHEPDAVPPAAAAPEPGHGDAAAPMRAGTRPRVARSQPIDDYGEAELRRLLTWIRSDGRLRTDDELLEAMMDELGLDRHGRRIDARLLALIQEPSG